MRLTFLGAKSIAFYLALVGAFFASPYSNLFFLLLGFLTLVGIASLVWTRRNLRGVRASVCEPDPIASGATASLPARIETPSNRGAFQVRVDLGLGTGSKATGQLDWVKGSAQLSLSAQGLARGVYPLADATISSTYPFGVLRVMGQVDGEGELIVYPAPSSLAEARSGREAIAELLGEQPGGNGELQPSGLRDYREGDDTRSVHWRATARRGKPIVREWEGSGGQGLEVLLDRRCEPVELDEALSTLTALIALARAEKEVLAITSQNLVATFGEGHRPWREALRFTAVADVLPSDAPAPPPVSPSVTRLTPTHAC